MRTTQIDNPRRRHLRFVFRDTVRSSDVGLDATLLDVAQALDDLALSRYGRPVAIDLCFPAFYRSDEVRPLSVSRLRKLRHRAGKAPCRY